MRDKIRLYTSPDGDASILGLTEKLKGMVEQAGEELETFLELGGQAMKSIETPDHLTHLPGAYYEIIPPLREEQVRRFSRICIKYADNGFNHVDFIDNRQSIPERAMQVAGDILAEV